MLSPVVVDLECFAFRSTEWVVKEIAICGDYLDGIVLKPPYPFHEIQPLAKPAYKWITKHLHGLQWDDGHYPYDFLYDFVQSVNTRYPHSTFYTKGLEKKTFLSNLFNRSFTDLNDLNCPKIGDLDYKYINCKQSVHLHNNHCAVKKAKAYHTWLQNHLDG